jgi:hypothetical protein
VNRQGRLFASDGQLLPNPVKEGLPTILEFRVVSQLESRVRPLLPSSRYTDHTFGRIPDSKSDAVVA